MLRFLLFVLAAALLPAQIIPGRYVLELDTRSASVMLRPRMAARQSQQTMRGALASRFPNGGVSVLDSTES